MSFSNFQFPVISVGLGEEDFMLLNLSLDPIYLCTEACGSSENTKRFFASALGLLCSILSKSSCPQYVILNLKDCKLSEYVNKWSFAPFLNI